MNKKKINIPKGFVEYTKNAKSKEMTPNYDSNYATKNNTKKELFEVR